jgi:hypothetical protein
VNKQQKLIILRGLNIKAAKLRTLTTDHYNAGTWDTEQSGKDAARLLDEIIDMSGTLRTELL